MFKALIVLIFLLGFGIRSSCLPVPVVIEEQAVTAVQKNDSTKVKRRYFDQQRLNAYASERDFKYDNAAPDSNTFWDRFWSSLWRLIRTAFKSKYGGHIIIYLTYAAAAALVIFIIFKLIGVDLRIFMGKAKAVHIPYGESEENIDEINFDQEIEDAMSKGNFRLGVRLLYLRSLKTLSDKQMISWQPEKTNQTYLNEITDADKKQQFGQLTRQFEYIWYGEFFIDAANFKALKENYDQFSRGIA